MASFISTHCPFATRSLLATCRYKMFQPVCSDPSPSRSTTTRPLPERTTRPGAEARIQVGVEPQRVQPVWVGDIALAVRRAFERDDAWGTAYEIGGPDVLTMNEIIHTMLDVMGRRRHVVPVPKWLAKAGTLPLRFLRLEVDQHVVRGEVARQLAQLTARRSSAPTPTATGAAAGTRASPVTCSSIPYCGVKKKSQMLATATMGRMVGVK